jgi:N-acetyl-gamma-glutamyl-phosphate reductase
MQEASDGGGPMGARVAVAGASGYAGGELLRLLAGHPDLELVAVTGDSSAGQTVGAVHAHLAGVPGLADLVLAPADQAGLAACDLVFAALPAGQSAALAARLPGTVKIVDLGPDFRLADPAAWARHYDGEHPGRWVTGLPELAGARDRIAAASRVAAPGCYATAAILALVPVVAAGLAGRRDVVVVAASGTSGAGRSPRASLLGSEVMGSVSAYAAGGAHRHTAEIEQALTELTTAELTAAEPTGTESAGTESTGTGPASVSFTPLLAPMPRGILATCTAPLTRPGISTDDLRAAISDAYGNMPFVCLLPPGRWPATASVYGANGVQLQVAADERAGRAVVVAAIDNLGKGAAGQAIQNANLMLGLPETAGLTASGVAP